MITGSGAVTTMDALAAGVRGVADVSVSVDSLVLALHTIAGGHVWIDDQSASGMRERITNGPPPDALDGLSDMERKAAELLAQGLSNKEIASRLYVADKTVKNYISKILLKLDVRNRQQAALIVRGIRPGRAWAERLQPDQDGRGCRLVRGQVVVMVSCGVVLSNCAVGRDGLHRTRCRESWRRDRRR